MSEQAPKKVVIPKEYENVSEFNDFGFTSGEGPPANNEELRELQKKLRHRIRAHQNDLRRLERLIMPLFVSLSSTPDEPNIHWPNRKAIIDEKIEELLSITRRPEEEQENRI